MAATTGTSRPTSSGESKGSTLLGRDRLARLVVVGSFLTLFLLVGILIFLAQSDNQAASDTAKNAFTAVLPVLAGWVGTVLAFYFSSASQERTSESLDKVIGRPGAGTSAPVAATMIPFATITGIIDLALDDNKPEKITIDRLKKMFGEKLPSGGTVTRLLFVESGIFRYVMHISALNAFIANADNSQKTTFSEMLADEETLRQISKLVVFVASSASLAEAKLALDKVKGAQDIIVTSSGISTEPMLGWLSNIDLTKALQVS